MERMTGLDASFLYLETPTQHLHVCALLILDPAASDAGYSYAAVQTELACRLDLVPQMRRRIREVPLNLDHPVWVDDPKFDLDNHIHRAGLPAPGERTELAELVADIASTPMDRNRPLWEMTFVEGLADGRIAVVCKYHHAAVDGVTAADMLLSLCDLGHDAARTAESSRWTPEPQPPDWKLLTDAAVRLPTKAGVLGMVPKTLGILAGFAERRRKKQRGMALPLTAPRTPLNGAIGARRTVAFVESRLDTVKEIKKSFGVTVNDVVMTIVGGVLRDYLGKHDELPDRSLIASVPVSVHGQTRHTDGINKVSSLFTELGTDIADPVERLRAVALANRHAKREHEELGADFLRDWSKYAPPNAFRFAARMYDSLRLAERHPVVHNLVVSNVPGPPMPLNFLGVRVASMFPFGPVFHGAGLTVTVLSIDGRLDFGFIASRDLVPDISALADAVPAAVDELLVAARESTDRRTSDSRDRHAHREYGDRR
ncbi:WS/DGAT/MGAT family O-acyltransferase [Nocardia bovistercoris]|uniref:Diacylglycerol O-acyltransferase n=1 Tax=Nocardia bovistercoris TaxID=2785916 RepID=A0A931IB74_9NOCA|nr:wax ester/triacylglycerol synthase family O-acyltransferase [Nocardia bovistercoris]MBH0777298.1 wax ester/triacylglycerol synthase family O-acyltransferase [Nocardia bovistercoris]